MKGVEFEYCLNNEEKIHSLSKLVYVEIDSWRSQIWWPILNKVWCGYKIREKLFQFKYINT